MLYRLRRGLARSLFDYRISKILDTPPIHFVAAEFTIVSMVSHDDLLMYLLAIKSLYVRLRAGRITIINDGTLTSSDRAILEHHLEAPVFIERKAIPIGRYLRHIMWERLAYELDLSAERYVIQLDSDTITLGPVSEVLNCIAENRAFTLGTWDGQEIVSAGEASAKANRPGAPDHIQILCEKALGTFPADTRYVRGSAGFVGLARAAFSRPRAEEFCVRMRALLGDRFSEWGSDQIGLNYIVANSPNPVVLPVPDYGVVGRTLNVAEARFLHFIGTYRFKRGIYARLGRDLIESAALAEGGAGN